MKYIKIERCVCVCTIVCMNSQIIMTTTTRTVSVQLHLRFGNSMDLKATFIYNVNKLSTGSKVGKWATPTIRRRACWRRFLTRVTPLIGTRSSHSNLHRGARNKQIIKTFLPIDVRGRMTISSPSFWNAQKTLMTLVPSQMKEGRDWSTGRLTSGTPTLQRSIRKMKRQCYWK